MKPKFTSAERTPETMQKRSPTLKDVRGAEVSGPLAPPDLCDFSLR
jgi:hypothetical protein